MRMGRRTTTPSTAHAAGKPARRAANLSLPIDLLTEARRFGINLSRAGERGLALAVAEAKSRRWAAENKVAIESSNRYVQRHGLPLARHRRF